MNINNLVFSGGSIKALVYIGCIRALEEFNLVDSIKTVAGTSAGGIFSLLYVLGYSSKELTSLTMGLNFSIFKDITTETILAFMNNYGIDTGEKLVKLIKILINKKVNDENITFQQLFDKTNKKLILTGTCLNKNRIEYFSYKTHPNMKIIDAIRITFSIPLIYNKVEYENDIYIDGAIMDNYPIQIFKQYKDTTLGFLISNNDCNFKINDITSYIKSIMSCVNCRLKHYQQIGFEDNTIELKTDINGLNFNLNLEEKSKLIETGYNQTKKYLNEKLQQIKEKQKLNETNNNIELKSDNCILERTDRNYKKNENDEKDENDNNKFELNQIEKYDLETEIQILLDDLDDLESGIF